MFQFSQARPGEEPDPEEVLAHHALYLRDIVEEVRNRPHRREHWEKYIETTYAYRNYPITRTWFSAMLDGKDHFGYSRYLEGISTPSTLPEGFVEKPQKRGRNPVQRRVRLIGACEDQRQFLERHYRDEKTDGFIEMVPGLTIEPNDSREAWFTLTDRQLYFTPKVGKFPLWKNKALGPFGRIADAIKTLDQFKLELSQGKWEEELDNINPTGTK